MSRQYVIYKYSCELTELDFNNKQTKQKQMMKYECERNLRHSRIFILLSLSPSLLFPCEIFACLYPLIWRNTIINSYNQTRKIPALNKLFNRKEVHTKLKLKSK